MKEGVGEVVKALIRLLVNFQEVKKAGKSRSTGSEEIVCGDSELFA